MADNFDTFTHILNEFQKLDGGSARKQAIKALQAMDKNLSAVESELKTAVQDAVEKDRRERAAAERESIDKAAAEAVAKDRQETRRRRRTVFPSRDPSPSLNPAACATVNPAAGDASPQPGLLLLGPRIRRQSHECLRRLPTLVETTICRRTCNPLCLSDPSAHDHALQMLAVEGSPARDSGGAKYARHPFSLRSESPMRSTASERTSSPVITTPATPFSSSSSSTSAPGKRTRPRLHSVLEPAPGAVRCHPAEHRKCRANAGGTLRAQIFPFSTSSPPMSASWKPRANQGAGSKHQSQDPYRRAENQKTPCFTQTKVLSPSTRLRTVIVFRPFRLAQTRVLVLSTGFRESGTNRTHALLPERRVRGIRGFGHWEAEECGRFWQRRRPEKPGPLDLHSRTKSDGRPAPRHWCQRSGWCRTWRRCWRGLRGRPTAARTP